jgi:hypothetical protein
VCLATQYECPGLRPSPPSSSSLLHKTSIASTCTTTICILRIMESPTDSSIDNFAARATVSTYGDIRYVMPRDGLPNQKANWPCNARLLRIVSSRSQTSRHSPSLSTLQSSRKQSTGSDRPKQFQRIKLTLPYPQTATDVRLSRRSCFPIGTTVRPHFPNTSFSY